MTRTIHRHSFIYQISDLEICEAPCFANVKVVYLDAARKAATSKSWAVDVRECESSC